MLLLHRLIGFCSFTAAGRVDVADHVRAEMFRTSDVPSGCMKHRDASTKEEAKVTKTFGLAGIGTGTPGQEHVFGHWKGQSMSTSKTFLGVPGYA